MLCDILELILQIKSGRLLLFTFIKCIFFQGTRCKQRVLRVWWRQVKSLHDPISSLISWLWQWCLSVSLIIVPMSDLSVNFTFFFVYILQKPSSFNVPPLLVIIFAGLTSSPVFLFFRNACTLHPRFLWWSLCTAVYWPSFLKSKFADSRTHTH